jgi:hypothetical protein
MLDEHRPVALSPVIGVDPQSPNVHTGRFESNYLPFILIKLFLEIVDGIVETVPNEFEVLPDDTTTNVIFSR